MAGHLRQVNCPLRSHDDHDSAATKSSDDLVAGPDEKESRTPYTPTTSTSSLAAMAITTEQAAGGG